MGGRGRGGRVGRGGRGLVLLEGGGGEGSGVGSGLVLSSAVMISAKKGCI